MDSAQIILKNKKNKKKEETEKKIKKLDSLVENNN